MPTIHEEKEDFETRNLLPLYIPPTRMDAPWVGIPSNICATLVAPKIPKGMTLLHDIMPQIHKLSFEYYDTNKLRDLDRKKYMTLVKDTPESPNRFVTM